MYLDGTNGLTQDYALAKRYFQLAAAQGNAKAQSNLGYLYHFGLGVTQDYLTAAHYYNLAIAHGDVRPRTIRSMLIEDRGDRLRGSARGTVPQGAREAITHVESAEPLAGAREHLAYVLHRRRHCRQLLERRAGRRSDDARERRLAAAGRAVEDRGVHAVLLDRTP